MKSGKLFGRVTALVLAVCLLLSLVACGTNQTPDGGGSTVEAIDIQSTLALNINDEHTLQAALSPFGVEATVTWRSSDASVATVSTSGVVKGIKAGTAIIRASAGGKSANCTVTVTDPSQATVNVTAISFNKSYVELNVGDMETLVPTITPAGATDKTLTYTSSKPDVATVDATSGKVTAVKAGNAVITATSVNNVRGLVIVKVIGEGGEQGQEETPLHVKKVASLENRTDFIMGMDASAVPSLEAAGVVYKNFEGEEEDVFKILKDNGITDIRVRIWNYPYQAGHYGDVAYSYGGGNCDIENAVAIATRCKAAGLGVILDFHYSDFWSDPSKQYVPKEWVNYTTEQRENAIYEFTKSGLTKVKATDVKITMVQVGNETTRAICDAEWDKAQSTYCAYISAGSRAVREVTGTVANGGAKVAVHFTNPESRDYVGYANGLKSHNVDYDVFGSSYYPSWHGSLTNLASKLKAVNEASGKDVMVLETSYGFTNLDFDGTGNTAISVTPQPLTVQGQSNQIRNVIETVANLGDYGLGVCYWEGTWIAPADNRAETVDLCNTYGCGWASAKAGPASIGGDGYQASDVTTAGGVVIDNQAFFMSDGTPLKSLALFKLAKTGQDADPVADYLYDEEVYYTVNIGEIELPTLVSIVLNDGSIMKADVTWKMSMDEVREYIKTVGDYPVKGTTPYGGEVTCTVYVQNPNILTDGGFEAANGYEPTDRKKEIPEPWKCDYKTTTNLQLYVSNDRDNAKMGTNSFHFWDDSAIEFRLYQEFDASALTAVTAEYGYGKYGISFDIMGGDGGDAQEVYAYAIVTYKNNTTSTIKGSQIELTIWKDWHRTAIAEFDIDDTVASIKVGIYVKAAAGAWGNIDNAQFYRRPAEA